MVGISQSLRQKASEAVSPSSSQSTSSSAGGVPRWTSAAQCPPPDSCSTCHPFSQPFAWSSYGTGGAECRWTTISPTSSHPSSCDAALILTLSLEGSEAFVL